CDIGYIRQFTGKVTENLNQRLLKEFDLVRKLDRDDLSGGEHTRLKIANAFSKDNVLLFADEPTSNLDFKGIELLRQKLEQLDSFVMVSHDRGLLDSLCNKIVEVGDGKIRIFNGNYTFYRQQIEMEHERSVNEYEKYVEEKEELENAIEGRKHRAKKMLKAPKRMGNSEARLHRREANERQEKLNSAANSLTTRLEKLEVKEKPRDLPMIKLDFSLTNPPANKIIITGEKLDFSYGTVSVFKGACFKVYNGVKTALWGENGSGKTTLLNLIHENETRSISIVPKARLAYFRQGFENLDPEETVLRNVMKDSAQTETTARTILARLLIQGDAVYKKACVLSGGERIKTAFAKMFVSSANVLLMDEPTNYLDMQSIEALESVLKDYAGTILFVSHDKAFVNGVADRLLVIRDNLVEEFDGKLEEYEARRVMPNNSSGNGKDPYSSGDPSKDMERTLLQMRLTETIAKLSSASGGKEALEEQYKRLVEQLKEK
ncbi:MAG: ribosomal protection-like ABC-F family protein, partial [Clostridiaceae bacterium]